MSKPSHSPMIMWDQLEMMPYLHRSSSTRSRSSGVVTRLGSGLGFATSSAVTCLATDAATVKVRAGTAEVTGGGASPTETELFAVGHEHCMFALGGWGKFRNCFPSRGEFCFAFGWKMVWPTTLKAMRALPLVGGLRCRVRLKAAF